MLALAGGARADEAPAGHEHTTWRCWFNAPQHVSCITPKARKPFVHIPLLTVPVDLDGPRQLARAVMCGSRVDCAVNFSGTPPAPHEIADAFDQLLVAGE